ncbi:hypothetical protein, partial [Pseudodesulfovibrio sp.]|uniref:hypothetical protein n=1 Tax=Pseudodesulfovibrio sp. TaxID=2035812 RepID=UPI00262BF0E3
GFGAAVWQEGQAKLSPRRRQPFFSTFSNCCRGSALPFGRRGNLGFRAVAVNTFLQLFFVDSGVELLPLGRSAT